MTSRVCPACGRTLQTRTNRFGVEMWPPHNWARIGNARQAERDRIYNENHGREPGRADWEVACDNSAQAVD